MKRPSTAILALIILSFVGCNQAKEKEKSRTGLKNEDNVYLSESSGGYTIEISGLPTTRDVELYVLADNGKAQWMHLKTNGAREPEVRSRKYGTWTARKSYIQITIDGSTGQLVEEYEMSNGVFYNKESAERYLKRTK